MFDFLNGLFDTGGQVWSYDYERQRASQQGLDQIFGVFGNIAEKMSAASAARDYADQMAQARATSYNNAMKIAAEQKVSNLKVADFSANLKLQNAGVLMQNAANMKNLSLIEHGRDVSSTQRLVGEARTQYASSGVQVGTGSALQTENYILKESALDSKNKFSSRLSQIKDFLTSAAQLETDAAYTKWAAEEQNRFVTMEASSRLY